MTPTQLSARLNGFMLKRAEFGDAYINAVDAPRNLNPFHTPTMVERIRKHTAERMREDRRKSKEMFEPKHLAMGMAGTVAIHRGGEAALTQLARQTSLGRKYTQNYYGALAKDGLDTGLFGLPTVRPQHRRMIGGLSPALTGLADYELWNNIGRDTRAQLLKQHGDTPQLRTALEEVRANLARGYSPGALRSNHPMFQQTTYESPLTRNLIHGLRDGNRSPLADRIMKVRGPDMPNAHSGYGKLFLDTLGGMATHGPGGAAGMAVTGLPTALVLNAADSGKLSTVRAVKSKIISAGMGAPDEIKGKWLQRLLAVMDPASSELVQFGRDISRVPQTSPDPIAHVAGGKIHEFGKHIQEEAQKPVMQALREDFIRKALEERRGARATQALGATVGHAAPGVAARGTGWLREAIKAVGHRV